MIPRAAGTILASRPTVPAGARPAQSIKGGIRVAVSADYLKEISFLIVEDQEFLRKLVRQVLEVFGVEKFAEAGSGEQGWKAFKETPTDVVLLDWKMPGMDGVELTRMIRKDPESPNPYVPIIMMTGANRRRDVMHARDAGVNEYIVKPVSAKAIVSRVEAVIERPRRFVKVGEYFGPDRRRQAKPFHGEDRRGKEAKKPAMAPEKEMAQAEINALFNPDTEGEDQDKG